MTIILILLLLAVAVGIVRSELRHAASHQPCPECDGWGCWYCDGTGEISAEE